MDRQITARSQKQNRITPPLVAKGVGVVSSRRSPGSRVRKCDTGEGARDSKSVVWPQAFPDLSSGPVRCPRLQLRGSAGFAPASLFFSCEKNARTYFRKQQECTRTRRRSQTLLHDHCYISTNNPDRKSTRLNSSH